MASSEGIEAASPDLGACSSLNHTIVSTMMDTTVMKRNTDLPKPFNLFIIQTINFLIY